MKHELKVITVLGYIILLSSFGYLAFTEDWPSAGQWALQASLLWEFVLWQIDAHLSLNRSHDGAPLYQTLGWGNRLTILRGLLIAMTGGFILFPHGKDFNDLLPALFYSIAAFLDRFDGYAARKSKQVSLLGDELDISFDALGLVIAPLLAISLDRLHPSYLLLSVAFYIYRWGLQYRSQRKLTRVTPPANTVRRTLAGFQMALLALIRLGIAFMLPVLFGFIVDWCIVCGWLTPKFVISFDRVSYNYFQPCLRGLLVVLLVIMARKLNLLDSLKHLSVLLVLLVVCSLNLILFGIAGRLGALIGLLCVGVYFDHLPSAILSSSLLFTLSWLLLLGTGRFSVWQWDDDWVKRYEGA